MADVDAIVLVAGEVRHVEKKRDFTDRESGEVRLGQGRKAKVLTFGGFIDLSIPAEADSWPVEEGEVILVQARVVPWRIAAKLTPNGEVRQAEKTGTAFVYVERVTAAQLDSLVPALADAK